MARAPPRANRLRGWLQCILLDGLSGSGRPQYSAFLTRAPGLACPAEGRPGLRFKGRGEGTPREDAESAPWGTALPVTPCQSCSVIILGSHSPQRPPPAGRGLPWSSVPTPPTFLNPSETLTCPELGAPGTPLLRGLLRGGGTLIMRTPKMHAIYAARPTASLSRQFLVCVSFCLSGPRSFASARDT